jgi:DNA repair protein SbcC/Rad50
VRVLAIRGQNLASLAGHFDVDLEHGLLESAGLYAITGPVGAGKSTLLDALCLALYDRTPRLGHGGVRIGRASEADEERLRDRDVRTILRRGTIEGFAEVDFVGRGGVRYRARWSVRHAHGRADGRIQKQTLRLTEIDTGKVIGANKTEVLTAIQERVGLSFEQFCRSVLLAQGDFAAFLKASAKDRAALLERMTGSELYGQLSIAAHERAREHGAELKLLREQRRERQPLEPEARKQMEGDLAQRQAVLVQCRARLEVAAAACAWHQKEQRLQKEIAEARTQLTAAKVAQESARVTQTAAAARFSDDAERMCAEFQASLDDLAERRATATGWLGAHAGLERLAGEWPRWQSVLARYLEGSVAVASLEQTRLSLDERLAELRAHHRQAEERKTTLYQGLQEADAARTVAIQKLETAAPEALRERRQMVETERFLLQKVEGRLGAIETAKAEAERVQERVSRARDLQGKTRRMVDSAGARLGPLKVQLAEADRAFQHAQQVLSLTDRRQGLVAGEPCPLCGATEHPYHEPGSSHGLIETGLGDRVQELRAEVSLVEKQITASQTDFQNQVRAEEEAATELTAHEQTVQKLESDVQQMVAQLVPEIREHTDNSQRLQARLVALATELDKVQVQENEIIALERSKQAADTAVENQRHLWLAAIDALRSVEEQLRKDEGELVAATSRRDQLLINQQDLVQELAEVMDASGDASGEGWQDRLQRDPCSFAAECGRQVEEYRAHEAAAAQAVRDLDAARPVLMQLHSLLVRGIQGPSLPAQVIDPARLQTVAAVLADADISGEPRRLVSELQRAVAAEAERRQEEARRHDELERRCREASTIIGERTRVHNNHQHDRASEQDAVAAQAARDNAARAVEDAQADCQETRVKLEVDDNERRVVAELEPRIASQEEACRVWQALDDLIGSRDGARFRVFAQSLTLDVLLQTANHHLAELAPRYRLMRVPGHDLDLQVVDLDMAEEIRGVNSLSGGETFLVSLALALALASLSAHQTPVESLFIDEGLGTLDTQTLDTALSTLDALQASGRKVGLISHVAGTAERIGVQVRVSPVGGGRSKVEVVT